LKILEDRTQSARCLARIDAVLREQPEQTHQLIEAEAELACVRSKRANRVRHPAQTFL
jgi:hypothetical protein